MIKAIKNIMNNQLYAISLYLRQIAGTLILFIIARYLSVYDFGLFSSYKNIATFCLMFANLGFADYILVSSKANHNEVKLKISLFLTNAILFAMLVCLGGIFCSLESKLLFCLVVIRTFFDGVFFALILPYFQATKKFNVIAMINIIYAVCIMCIALISYIFKLSLIKFLVLNIILGTINFIQCSYYARINYFLFFNNFKRFLNMLDKSIWAYIGSTIANTLYSQISSLYVSTYVMKEQAAVYFSALTISSIVWLLINAQTQKMIPEIIKETQEKVRIIIKKNLIFILFATSTVFLFMVIFGKLLLQFLYGQIYYTNGYYILLILMMGNIFVAEAGVFGAYITASGNQKKKIPMQLEATILTVAGLILLHRFGIYGAALSYLFAATYIAIRYTLTTKQIIKIKENKNGRTIN